MHYVHFLENLLISHLAHLRAGQIIWVQSFLFIYQALLTFAVILYVQVWTVSLPLTILNSPAISSGSDIGFGTAADIVGVVLWAIGWIIETVADAQKVRGHSLVVRLHSRT